MYNPENGFPKAVSDALDKFDIGIEYSRVDDENANKKGFDIKVFDYLPETGVEWYNYFLLENGTLKELLDSVLEYLNTVRVEDEAVWIYDRIGIDNPESALLDLAKNDAEYLFANLKSFTDEIIKSYPDLSNDVLVNDNLQTDEKIKEYIQKNFVDEEDVIMTFMNQASLQDKLDFLDLPAKDIFGNIDNYIEDSLTNMPDDVFHDFAMKYGAVLMAKGIQSEGKKDLILKSISINDLGLSIRTVNVLKRNGIESAAEIKEVLDEDYSSLMKLRNMGKKGYKEIIEKMDEISGSNYCKKEEIVQMLNKDISEIVDKLYEKA